MASIANDPGGRRRILFLDKHDDRKVLWLGKVSKRLAGEIRTKVEAMNAAAMAGHSIDGETAEWLAKIGNRLHVKLAKAGLVAPREATDPIEQARLKEFIDRYVDRRTDAKARTRLNLHMFGDRLIAFFGADKLLAEIKRSDADDWLVYLKGEYAMATVGRTVKGARQIFKAACRADIIMCNPFEDLKAGSNPDKDRQHFITHEVSRAVLDACPDAEWRLIVALSRYGGLRCPSEHLALAWPDVDWERDRFRVTSPKTEHHEGKEERWVPIFPELRPYLEEAFDLARERSLHVITRYRNVNQNLRTQFLRIIRKAGLTPWPKLFQNLRASRETELAALYPLHVVCAWIGNSTLIAQKHYLQITDDYFVQAARKNSAPDSAFSAKTAQKTAQHGARTEHARNEKTPENPGFFASSPGFSGIADYAWRDSNPQPTAP